MLPLEEPTSLPIILGSSFSARLDHNNNNDISINVNNDNNTSRDINNSNNAIINYQVHTIRELRDNNNNLAGTNSNNSSIRNDFDSNDSIQRVLNEKDPCEVIYGWILILTHAFLFCVICWLYIYLIQYAPRTHGWNSISRLYGIDIYTDETSCRTINHGHFNNDKDHRNNIGTNNSSKNTTQIESIRPRETIEFCPSTINNSNITTTIESFKPSAQCMNKVLFGNGLSQRLLYFIGCFGSSCSLIWYLCQNNKMTDMSFLVELLLGLSFVASCFLLPILVVRSIIELNGLKGNMALDWSLPNLISEFWLETQKNGNCCGIDRADDIWRVPISAINDYNYSYPMSCCNPTKTNCNQNSTVASCHVWSKGCWEIEQYKLASFGTALALFVVVQIVFSIYGICLVSGIKARLDNRVHILTTRRPGTICPAQMNPNIQQSPSRHLPSIDHHQSDRSSPRNSSSTGGPTSSQSTVERNTPNENNSELPPRSESEHQSGKPASSSSSHAPSLDGPNKIKPYPKPIHPPKPNVEIMTIAQILETAKNNNNDDDAKNNNINDNSGDYPNNNSCFVRIDSVEQLVIESAEETSTMYQIKLKKFPSSN